MGVGSLAVSLPPSHASYVGVSSFRGVNVCAVLVLPPDDLSPNDEPEFLYYMNDGVYGSFSSKLLGDAIPPPSVHKVSVDICGSWRGCTWDPTPKCRCPCPHRPPWWRSRCSPAASGGPHATPWTRWWTTACCPSSMWGTGSSSGTWGLTAWASKPPTPAWRACPSTTLSQNTIGKQEHVCAVMWRLKFLLGLLFGCEDLFLNAAPFCRYEMQDAGFGLDAPMRSLLLGPYSFQFNQQEDAFSTPA